MVDIGRGSRVADASANAGVGPQDASVPGKRTLIEQLPGPLQAPSAGPGGVVQLQAAGTDKGAVSGTAARTTVRRGSHGEDVSYLQQKLNAVMQAGLEVDGQFGPATLNAVRAFQTARGLTADGVVGPLTWGQLDGVAPATVVPAKPPVVAGGTPDHAAQPVSGAGPATPEQGSPAMPVAVDGVRAAIVATARSQIGMVTSDVAGAPDETGKATRLGWEHLLQYFEVAFGGSGPGKFSPDVVKYHSFGKGGKNGLPSWCGIFAVWACKTNGVPLGNWKLGTGVSALLKPTSDPQPGDIGYVDQPFQHHCIVASVNGNSVVTIDGNSGGNGSIIEHTNPRQHYSAFYRIPI